jgi:hypothetical protein
MPDMSLKKIFATAVLATTFGGTQYFLAEYSHNAPKQPEVVAAVTRSLHAEIEEAQKPLPEGKVIEWSVPNSLSRLQGTATIVGRESDGSYDVNVQTNLRTPYKSDATYKVRP